LNAPSVYLEEETDRGTGIDWTPALIQSAEWSADVGYTRSAIELCERLISDGEIKGDLDTRSDALLASDVEFLRSGDGRRSGKAVRALEAEEDYWLSYQEQQLRLIHQWGLVAGFSFAQAAWVYQKGRYTPIWKFVGPKAFRWDWDKRCWWFRERFGAMWREIQVTPGDGRWLMYTPFGTHKPWMYGLWRALSRLYLLKQYGIADWGNYSDRQGSGARVVTGFKGTDSQRAQLTTELRAMGRNASIVLKEGVDYKLVESVARTWEGFQAQIKLCDSINAVAILGQDIAAPGASTAASAKERVALNRTRSDSLTLGNCIREHGFIPWAINNYGDANLAPWVSWCVEPPAQMKERAAVVQMAAQAFSTLKTANAKFDERAFLDEFDIAEGTNGTV